MRRFHAKVFDDIVHTSLTTETVTSSRYNQLLGRFDNLVIQVICTNAELSGDLSLYLQHSSDGRTWEYKGSPAPVTVLTPVTPGETTFRTGVDTTGIPSLAFVRFWMSLIPGRARVRVYVTARDAGA